MKLEAVWWPAVRAFERVWGPIADQLELGEAADAGFDAGEWSGPAHANMELEAYNQIVDYVAQKFGIPGQELDQMIELANHYQTDQWWKFMEGVNK